MRDNHLSRRHFLRNLAVAGTAGSVIMIDPALAEELPRVAADDPLAANLQYVEDASTSTAPSFKEGSNCANCALIQGNDGDAYRPCAIFPGKVVAASGWCISWAPKP